MKKIGLLCLALVMSLGLLGVGYAMWSQELTIEADVETGELDWEFVFNAHTQKDPCTPVTNDWNLYPPATVPVQMSKSVGCSTVNYTDTDGDTDYDLMEVTLNTVYPYYYEHIAFKLHNNGTIPIIIQKVVIDGVTYTSGQPVVDLDLGGDSEKDIRLWYGDSFGTQVDPCNNADISFDVLILQGAPQGATLNFSFTITGVQWNEYP